MDWRRAPNKLRHRRLRAVNSLRECDLGPVIGSIEPMRPIRRASYHQPHRWMAHGWQSFWGFIFVALYVAFVVGYICLMFVLGRPTPAKAQTLEQRVIHDCSPDARRLCKHVFIKGRQAIIDCMRENKAKLGPRCRVHIWG